MPRRFLLWWERAVFRRGVCRGPREAAAQGHYGEIFTLSITLIPSPDLLVTFDNPTRWLQISEYVVRMCPLGRIIDAVEIEPLLADPDPARTLHCRNHSLNVGFENVGLPGRLEKRKRWLGLRRRRGR